MISHFPKHHDLHKLINKNNNKISYSCTPNIGMIIAGHNKKLLDDFYKERNPANHFARTCNCRANNVCPLDGNCLQKNTLYNAKITAFGAPTKNYIGIAATTFKERHSNHKSAFNNRGYQPTTLSTYYWKLKDRGKNPNVSFSTIRVVPSYSPECDRCRLCTAEKIEIMNTDPSLIVNTRKEILSVCRHKKKFMLENKLRLRTKRRP